MTIAEQARRDAGSTVAVDREAVGRIAADLLARGVPVAPHVIGKLLRLLAGDAGAVLEVIPELDASQRSGQRMLPRLLPLVPSVSSAFEDAELDAGSHRVLLLAALCTDDDLDLLTDASILSADELATGRIGEHLRIAHGRCRFVDPRMPMWLEHSASAAAVLGAHESLSEAHRRRGDAAGAAWHRARGALERRPDVAPILLAEAREAHESGDAARAFLLAVEAADHASGAVRDEAVLVAGSGAAAAGCFEDAADWLGGLFPNASHSVRSRALPILLIAETCARGAVPVVEPSEHRPGESDPRGLREWARTAGAAGLMYAARGMVPAMRGWLTELRDADARAGEGGTICEPVISLCRVLCGEGVEQTTGSSGPFSGSVIGALLAAVEGDIDQGLRVIARASAARIDESDPLVPGFERGPAMRAQLAIVEALLLFWRGDVSAARELLEEASIELPIAAPFAGLGAALSSRIEITAVGAPGVISQALAAVLPPGIRLDRLVDHGLVAYLQGAREQADIDITLWHDRGAPEPRLALPGLDEMGPIVEPRGIEPPEQSMMRELVARIRQLPESSWRREHDEIAAAGRGLRSPFSRGRVEALLGTACVVHGDVSAGRRHLRAARTLFESSGAGAWRAAVDDRLARLGAQLVDRSSQATAPIAVIHDLDPVDSSRIAWSAILSAREVEVAMRAVEGMTNGEIAAALEISVRTVEVHVGRVMNALGVRNRVELTGLAHRTGRHT